MREQYIEYRDGETLLEGFLCYDESQPGPRPAVLINHAWGGRDEFVERKARRLAWQGYACFALDNFGKGKRGTTHEECSALMTPFMKDRAHAAQAAARGARHGAVACPSSTRAASPSWVSASAACAPWISRAATPTSAAR